MLVVWFQASAATYNRTALFRAVTQCVVVNPCRRFGTTCRSHLQGSRILGFMTLEDRTDSLSRNVGMNYRYMLRSTSNTQFSCASVFDQPMRNCAFDGPGIFRPAGRCFIIGGNSHGRFLLQSQRLSNIRSARKERRDSVAYPGILFGGGVQQIQLRTEDRGQRERGSGGSKPPSQEFWRQL